MGRELILLDTNVIVAALAEGHQHHGPSLALLAADPPLPLAVAAHSYAEAYTTLTRRSEHAPFQWPPQEAWAALESVAAVSRLVGLSPPQTFEVVRTYAATGGVGARIYDVLIARSAQAAGARILVTWNSRHFHDLLEGIEIRTPAAMLAG